MNLRIRKPDDSHTFWETELSLNGVSSTHTVSISGIHGAKDPIHEALKQLVQRSISNRRGQKLFYGLRRGNNTLLIGTTPFLIHRSSRYYINGQLMKLEEMCHALARVLFKSCFEKDPTKLLPYLYATMELPESVKYVIENRVPYFFYDEFVRHDVRLNVQQISDEECAIEIGDGVWGNISIKDLNSFCDFYVSEKKSKWAYISPQNLYERLVGKKPSVSDTKVLVAFLKQNRKQAIVEERAEQLVKEMLEQYPNRLRAEFKDGKLSDLFIKGKRFDWKLSHRGGDSGTQNVSTFIHQPKIEKVLDEEGNAIKNEEGKYITQYSEYLWSGPICIDNMGNTPVGDQFASRALALLNDAFTIKAVSTINSYITDNENKNRVDWNAVR